MCFPLCSLHPVFTLIQEADVSVSEETRSLFLDLHRIVTALKAGDIDPALEYVVPFESFASINPCHI